MSHKATTTRRIHTRYALVTKGNTHKVYRFANATLRDAFVANNIDAAAFTTEELISGHIATEIQLQALPVRTRTHLLSPLKVAASPEPKIKIVETSPGSGWVRRETPEEHAADMAETNSEEAANYYRERMAAASEIAAAEIAAEETARLQNLKVGRLLGRIEQLMAEAVADELITGYRASICQDGSPDIEVESNSNH